RPPLALAADPRPAARPDALAVSSRQRRRRAVGPNDPQRLLDGRRDRTGPGVDHLVAGHEAVGLDGNRRADHVHDVARPQLARVPHVAVRRDPRPRVPLRGQAERVEERERRVAETREVVGDREVVVVIDLPLVDDAAIGLEADGHGTRLYNRRAMEMPRSRTLPDLLDEMAARHPGREAVVGTSGRLTYEQWRARARDLARGLHRLRVRPRDPVPPPPPQPPPGPGRDR